MSTQTEAERLLAEEGGDINAVARRLGLGPVSAGERMDSTPPLLGVRYVDDYWGRPKELGRADLRKYVVSSRHVNETGWPRTDREAIERARHEYDAGTHTLATGREGSYLVLYKFLLKKPVPKHTYFYGAERAL